MHLHELSPVGGRPASGRERRRFKRFAEVGENLPDGPRFRDEGDQPDVATTRWALERKLLPHPGHQLGRPNAISMGWRRRIIVHLLYGRWNVWSSWCRILRRVVSPFQVFPEQYRVCSIPAGAFFGERLKVPRPLTKN